MSTHPIDIVIPWVDWSDPVWQADHAKYRASKSADNHPARYREWGLFRYWFRGIEQNAPWVRKVHLLTYGHLPGWSLTIPSCISSTTGTSSRRSICPPSAPIPSS